MNRIDNLFKFIESSPTALHAAESAVSALLDAGYTELNIGVSELKDGGKYFITRGGAVIAFRMRGDCRSFNITASHSDSPALKLHFIPEVGVPYTSLGTERYGGTVNYTWFDRSLAIAGAVMISDGGAIRRRLVCIDDAAVIPSVAPHLAKDINTSFAPNAAVDLKPIYSASQASLMDRVASELGVSRESIISHELYLVNRGKPVRFGAGRELILSPRIDDLASVYAALNAFISAPDTSSVPVIAIFDHEEIGSNTKEGAASDMLSGILAMICPDKLKLVEALSSSLMLSVDGAHALHPNHPELSDPVNRPLLGGGVAVKYNANRKYATDLESDSLLRRIASMANIPLQSYSNRADLPGGSTLGSIAATSLAVPTVDIGIPQLAMHSMAETCAASDVESMAELLSAFYSTVIEKKDGALFVK